MYLIDGYNLFYQTNLDSNDEFVRLIHNFCNQMKKNALIVFDGYSPIDLSTSLVRVVYAGDADLEISNIIKKCDNPTQWVLVSSDKELIFLANQKKIKSIKSEQFEYFFSHDQSEEVGIKSSPYLTDEQIKKQLQEFNYFKKKQDHNKN